MRRPAVDFVEAGGSFQTYYNLLQAKKKTFYEKVYFFSRYTLIILDLLPPPFLAREGDTEYS